MSMLGNLFGKLQFLRRLLGVVLAVIFNGACVLIVDLALPPAAQAQFFDGGPPARVPPQHDSGFFGNWFGGFGPRPFFGPPPYYKENRPPVRRRQEAPADNSRAPAPRKAETNVVPTTSILVMGDGMADWLAYGLEDAFSDSPEVRVVRKNKIQSGLVSYEPKNAEEWSRVARDILAQEKANFVVMMIGLNDRQNIREKEIVTDSKKNDSQAASGRTTSDQAASDKGKSIPDDARTASNDANKSEQLSAPDRIRAKATGVFEFGSEGWAKLYSQRVDDTITALKSKGVPVFWVGLTSIRGTKSTADAGYLNDIYRARTERAGVVYIDVWDGFIDEDGKYTTYGPDYEGQTRRLRSSDGAYFTKYGARKLAHYVEREIRRTMNEHISVALPSSAATPSTGNVKPAERPLVGPVVPLTAIPDHAEALLGGAASATSGRDAIATQALVKGEPVPAPRGRADNFAWSAPDANEPATLDAKSPMSSKLASAPAAAQPQQAAEKNKSKKAKAAKSDKKTRDAQNTSTKRNNRQQSPRGRPERGEPLPLRSIFPFFGQ